MRKLTAKQKTLLNNYIKSETNDKDSWERHTSVFKQGKHFLDTATLPNEIWDKLVSLNDTEILYQEVDRYLMDESMKEIYN